MRTKKKWNHVIIGRCFPTGFARSVRHLDGERDKPYERVGSSWNGIRPIAQDWKHASEV